MSDEQDHPHGYKIALYPTPSQSQKLEQLFGNSRYVFNKYIQYREWEYDHGYKNKSTGKKSYTDVRTMLTVESKKQHLWLKESPASSLQEACKQADQAYKAMITKRSEGKSTKTPFRKKYGKQSFALPGRTSFDIRETDQKRHRGHLYVPKVGWIRYHAGKTLKDASSVTVVKNASGKYHASVNTPYIKPDNIRPETLAMDRGLTMLVTGVSTSGVKVELENPRWLKNAEKDIAKQQRALSRKKKDSRARARQKQVLAKAHEKVRNVRQDYLHKFSYDVAVNSHDVILEDLGVADMVKHRKYSKGISDASWVALESMLRYKISGDLVKTYRYFPSSKTCSECGHVIEFLDVSIRRWECPGCKTLLDRDGNAAVNIMVAGGRSETLNAEQNAEGMLLCGADVRRFSKPLSALKPEYFCIVEKKIYGDNRGLKITRLLKKPHL